MSVDSKWLGWLDRFLATVIILIHSGGLIDHYTNHVRASLSQWTPTIVVLVAYVSFWVLYCFRISRHSGSRFKTIARVLLAITSIAVVLMFIPPGHMVTELPSELQIMVADVENKTGDPKFTVDAVKQAFTTGLKESVRLAILPENRIQAALGRMRKSPTERISVDIGREICRREGVGLLVAPALAKSDGEYIMEARVIDPVTGQTLYETTVGSFATKDMADAVRTMVNDLRKKFGESSWQIYRNAKALAPATSESWQALDLYTKALKSLSEVKYSSAEATLNEALALDPDLAMAWVELASIHDYNGNNSAMLACSKRAFSLRDHLTDPERVRVDDFYYWHVENNHQKAFSELTDFLARYPKNQDRFGTLAYEAWMLMKFDVAEDANRELLGRRPWVELAEESSYDFWQAQLSRDKFKEAVETATYIQQDMPKAGYLPYVRAIPKLASGEKEAAKLEIVHIQETNHVAALWLGGLSDIHSGKLQSAFEQWLQYIRSIERSQTTETPWTTTGKAHLGLARLALLMGRNNDSRTHLKQVQAVRDEYLAEAGKYSARLGDLEEAERILDELKKRVAGRESYQNKAVLEFLEGEIELKRGNSERAFTLLSSAAAYPWTYLFFPVQESLGNAALVTGHYETAIRAFKSILDRKGLAAALDRPDAWIMAQYDAGRAYEESGDQHMALSYYLQFEHFWRDADAALPALADVRIRSAKLKG